MKRQNEEASRPFKAGDVRQDGYIFSSYCKTKVLSSGYFKERWLSPSASKRHKESMGVHGRRIASARYRKVSAIIGAYKVDSGCALCGYKEHHAALDFDHLDPSIKSFNISKALSSKPLGEIYAEMAKCRVLCANCHRKHSYESGHAHGVKQKMKTEISVKKGKD